MDTHEILVGRMRGGLTAQNYRDWAESLILSGKENDDLQTLAFSQNLHWEEIERCAPRILLFLGVDAQKAEKDIWVEIERRLIQQYKEGMLTGEDLVRAAVHLHYDSGYDKRFEIWFGLDDDLDIIQCDEAPIWYKWDTQDIEGSIRKTLRNENLI
jgi:hypothetical protein